MIEFTFQVARVVCMKYLIDNRETFKKTACILADSLHAGDIIFLSGDLGAGKTFLVRTLLNKWGYTDPVKSPTFTLVESYEFPQFTVNHFDLYRIEDPKELEVIGFQEYFNKQSIVFIEWPNKAQGFLPKATVEVSFTQ